MINAKRKAAILPMQRAQSDKPLNPNKAPTVKATTLTNMK